MNLPSNSQISEKCHKSESPRLTLHFGVGWHFGGWTRALSTTPERGDLA